MYRVHLKWSHNAFTIKSRLCPAGRVELVKLALELKYGMTMNGRPVCYFYVEAL